MADDVDLAVRAGGDVDVSGAGADAEGRGAADVDGLVKGAVGSEQKCRRDCQCRYCYPSSVHLSPPYIVRSWNRLSETRGARGAWTASRYCCSTTVSPSFKPSRISIRLPLEMPALTATFLCPSFCLGSGTKTEAFLSAS